MGGGLFLLASYGSFRAVQRGVKGSISAVFLGKHDNALKEGKELLVVG